MKTGTIIRTSMLVIALINQALVIFGKSPIPFSNEEIEQFISLLFTIVTSLLAWWKNNSFTKNAQKADEYKAQLKKK